MTTNTTTYKGTDKRYRTRTVEVEVRNVTIPQNGPVRCQLWAEGRRMVELPMHSVEQELNLHGCVATWHRTSDTTFECEMVIKWWDVK